MTALYVWIDDLLAQNPGLAPERPVVGFAPKLSDAELITLAVISALLGYDNESQFMRFAHAHLRPWFPCLPNRDGYNKRLRRSGDMIARVMGLPRSRVRVVARRRAAGGLHPGGVRPKPRDPKALRPRGVGPNTAGARRIPAGSGACACILWPHRQVCRSRSLSPARKPTRATSART